SAARSRLPRMRAFSATPRPSAPSPDSAALARILRTCLDNSCPKAPVARPAIDPSCHVPHSCPDNFGEVPMSRVARAVETESDEAQILDTIDRWVERDLRPIVREYDHADRYPHEAVERMKEFGLFGATVSPEYGGLGLSAVTYAKIVMRIS